MPSQFEDDLRHALEEARAAREGLLAVLAPLTDADLDRARRGGWSVRQVLEHLVLAEKGYLRVLALLRESPEPPPRPEPVPVASLAQAVRELEAGRRALLEALREVDEELFYTLRPVGREQFSVLSLLENLASHEREHTAQIKAILEATS